MQLKCGILGLGMTRRIILIGEMDFSATKLMSGGDELFAVLRHFSQTTRPRAELRNITRMCSELHRRVASRVQAAGRRSNAAQNFKEKMVFNLNTPLPSVEYSIW